MANYINPTQLKEVAESIKDCIAELTFDIFTKLPDLSKYDMLVRTPITFKELNTGDYLSDVSEAMGIRIVHSGSTSKDQAYGVSLSFSNTSWGTIELYIGSTSTPEGDSATLATPTVNGYSRLPGISIAFRANVFNNLLYDKNIVTEKGLSSWHVMTLADYTGFKLGSGGSGSEIWFGTLAQYEALATTENGVLYCITD